MEVRGAIPPVELHGSSDLVLREFLGTVVNVMRTLEISMPINCDYMHYDITYHQREMFKACFVRTRFIS